MKISKKASKINLSGEGLTEFPMELMQCKNLRKLNLSHNQIKVIPKEISKLKYLQNLDVSHNKIKVLFAGICNLPYLEVLVANDNLLKKFPEQINLLQRLKKLSLASNQLIALPSSISSLPALTHLDISANNFKEFPSQIFSNKTVTHLWLGKNIFNEFSSLSMAKELPALEYLYCFGATTDSVNSVHNDYAMLQQKKGNSVELLKLLAKNTDVQIADKKPNPKRKIFISYSHKDVKYKEEIEVWLKGIKYLGFDFTFWSDTHIMPGAQWEDEIKTALREAGIVINVISQYYMASDFIQQTELPTLLGKAKEEGTLVLNLIARRCAFSETKLAPFQAINDIKDPVEAQTKDGQDSIYLAMLQRIITEFKINQ
jgi:hypothetical protein